MFLAYNSIEYYDRIAILIDDMKVFAITSRQFTAYWSIMRAKVDKEDKEEETKNYCFESECIVHGILFSQLGLYNLMFKRIFPSHNIFASSTIYNSFILYKRISEQYLDQDILEYIRALIPEEIVKKTGIEIEEKESLQSALQWFKKDFMRWTSKDPKCERCNLPMGSQSIKGNSWKLRSMETYTCSNCYSVQVFPRYGEIQKIAETRTGRCSEWSMLFGAMLNSLSIKTRIVHDKSRDAKLSI